MIKAEALGKITTIIDRDKLHFTLECFNSRIEVHDVEVKSTFRNPHLSDVLTVGCIAWVRGKVTPMHVNGKTYNHIRAEEIRMMRKYYLAGSTAHESIKDYYGETESTLGHQDPKGKERGKICESPEQPAVPQQQVDPIVEGMANDSSSLCGVQAERNNQGGRGSRPHNPLASLWRLLRRDKPADTVRGVQSSEGSTR